MTSTTGNEAEVSSQDNDGCDEWIDFEIILSGMVQQIGVIRHFEAIDDMNGHASATGEFFGMARELYRAAEELYAAYMSGGTCVYCGREPQHDWSEVERHDDVVFFVKDGKTVEAHRFCRNEALRQEAEALG